MLDRTKAPDFQIIKAHKLPEINTQKLKNGISFHQLITKNQPVLGFQIVFEAGRCQENKTGEAAFMAKILLEGTHNHTGKQIADKISFYGASINVDSGNDFTIVSFYTLGKHLEELLPLLKEILQEPTFPQSELDNLKNRSVQNLKIQEERTAYKATVELKKVLFKGHPYSASSSEESIRVVQRQDIIDFYENNIKSNPFEAYLVGDIDANSEKLITDFIESFEVNTDKDGKKLLKNPSNTVTKIYEEIEGSVQTSIRIGRILFDQKHSDFPAFKVMNMILGGYFGSRLMQNIREDKGYTYGISSRNAAMKNGSYFVIGTDVKKEIYQDAVNEIYKEIEKLKNEPVSEEELENVKNYMSGNFLGSLSTAFAVMDKIQDIHVYNLDENYYNDYITKLRKVTIEDVQKMAQKYLVDLSEVCIG
ncbi:putative Zn-dependent peptidase [Bernardetia litoralis DSM 6794]|uniref:Putative Zn-dependent peptidase n=1 Tax=Bernardetia litoralis (strain ATCC 23117 / DSM 6794 / NBRC 15988 / NCIMB 1366 / Fx l1 / Sio-4) TaxID=880071 RepID=I4ANZ6_BERLS|nr:pitrilysin family protein [Bernardetia litoralis]AFM05681.1 putative Zn-dependent peptidase [Bernardetia litoralis DSM 6794]